MAISPTHSISLDQAHCEVHFSVGGFWRFEDMQGFLQKLNEAALPLTKARKPIRALGDMSELVPQDRQTGDLIRDHLLGAQNYGLERIAIVSGSALTKIQYRRLSQGLEVEFFEDKSAALVWLRRAATQTA
jgi:hypothetical protein